MKYKRPHQCCHCVLFHPLKNSESGTCIRDVQNDLGARKEAFHGDSEACEHFRTPKAFRRSWSRFQWRFWATNALSRIWFWCVRFPLGLLRKPIPIAWQDDYDVVTDSIIPNKWPMCLHCGDMPYSTTQCQFCGRRFTKEDNDDGI